MSQMVLAVTVKTRALTITSQRRNTGRFSHSFRGVRNRTADAGCEDGLNTGQDGGMEGLVENGDANDGKI